MPRLDEVLAQGVRDLQSRRQRDPAVYSELMMMFAHTYDRMGDAKNARALAAHAYAHSLGAFGANDPHTIRALALRGQTDLESPAGIADVKAALAQMRRLHMEGVPMAEVLDALGTVEISTNRPKQAAVLFTEAQRHRRNALGPAHPDLALDYANLGHVELGLGHPARALELFERAYRHSVRYDGAETRRAAGLLAQLASAKGSLVGWRGAERDYDATLAVLERIDPDGSPERVNVQFEICVYSVVVDDMARAGRSCNEVVSLAERIYGEGSRMHEAVRRNRITYLTAQGRLAEAKLEGARVRAGLEAIPGDVARVSLGLFDVMYSDVQYIEGDHVGMRDALLARRPDADTLWPGMSALLHARLALACDYAPSPKCPAGLREAADTQLTALGERLGPASITGQLTLTRLALRHADAADAHRRLDRIMAIAGEPRASLPASHRWLAEARMLRGDAYAAQGHHEAAVREWHAAETVFASRYTPQHPFRRQLRERLGTRVATR
jgi:tetratricopeptide (TPR) repeat protein